MATAPVAAASLVAGYGVARRTGTRRRGTPVAAALVGFQLGAFFASHRLAHKLGAWPGILITSATCGAAAAIVGDRRWTTNP